MKHAASSLIIVSTLLASTCGSDFSEKNDEYLRFPPNFLIGAATAAYQIEGAWNVSDKAESNWDRFVHQKDERVFNNDTGDVACDSYHKFREDVALLKQVGMKAYRFSLSWPRILPTGFANKVSKDGIAYYHKLIDELLANDIEPIATIYHWDHPQVIEDAGGWLNPHIVDWFGDYARIVFKEFAPKVKKFITLNEPSDNCIHIYAMGIHAPAKMDLHGVGEYICGENMLKAHARAYRIYQQEFKDTYNGSLGDYPEIMKNLIASKSKKQGFPRSRLPELGADWVDYIRGTSDFLAVNHYTSVVIEPGDEELEPSFFNDQGLIRSQDPTWRTTISVWLKIIPEGFGSILRKLAEEYNNPLMYVTENGVSGNSSTDDDHRVNFYEEYLKEMLIAINRDNVNVKGYLLWSFLDSFEWERGYSEPFGIIHVNFTDPERKRTLKKSAHWWKEVIKCGSLKIPCSENENSVPTPSP
ncbi:hypothetical protein KPH14_005860 [Odynerus spinipes]|uniref:beta-glucosidase n=1 Tax=Odynerus spinipes TaxID=1348599 RepID=A0AAD9RB77_9HYME|nr:hypothetical protein KPH14_005860 [Odynerus spinipes]